MCLLKRSTKYESHLSTMCSAKANGQSSLKTVLVEKSPSCHSVMVPDTHDCAQNVCEVHRSLMIGHHSDSDQGTVASDHIFQVSQSLPEWVSSQQKNGVLSLSISLGLQEGWILGTVVQPISQDHDKRPVPDQVVQRYGLYIRQLT